MPAELIRSERHREADARSRLKTLGAAYQEQHSKPGRQVYYSGRHDVWILVVREGRDIVLGMYKGCPC